MTELTFSPVHTEVAARLNLIPPIAEQCQHQYVLADNLISGALLTHD